MSPLTRRDLLRAGAALAGAGLLPPSLVEAAARRVARRAAPRAAPGGGVNMRGDGLSLTPHEHAARLLRLASSDRLAADEYTLGGVVAELESAFAALLGKEAAVFMPTGTLANHLAIRALAGGTRGAGGRVLVPEQSHVYNDVGDALQALSGLTLVPLGRGLATFPLAEVEAEVARSASGRVATRVAALMIESPVRRRSGELFAADELARVTAYARTQGIALHLDGARMLIASAYTGVSPAALAAPFDTVYVSLYKGLNAPSGAILAGPRGLLAEMYHTRRMFGGGLPKAWPYAAAALEDLPGFVDRLRQAVGISEAVFRDLEARGVHVRRVTPGTNIAFLSLGRADPAGAQRALAAAGIRVVELHAGAKELPVWVNESWTRRPAGELATVLARALGAG